ncbi:MAG TPA: DUF1360 domain-containing protein [Thermoanaerobaculia bacterium]|jgi:hypothetical protein|nr:DUF1360 domain-containing protein [Thermoanaerobaculia bacterium]
MGFYSLIVGALCVWRITHLLSAEDGPGDVLVRLRRSTGNGFWGRLLDCFYCLSLWVAVPLALLLAEGWREGFLSWLAFSAGAILLERATGPVIPPAPYFEDEEDDHELLRQAERAVSGDQPDSPAGER